ncbi:MAG TPA: ABC transporter, partial [Mycobacterium sp.]
MTALAALTERVMVATLRDQDLLFAILAPVATFVGFTVTLRNLIDTGGMSYPQYVLPAVIVQAMLFGALT